MCKLMHRRLFGSLALIFLLLGSCDTHNPAHPPRMRFGKDICSECRMIITEERFAAAAVTDAKADKFDSIGCMVLHDLKNPQTGKRFWVRDYPTFAWIEGNKAFFVYGKNFVTPMGHGLIAFSERKTAEQFIRERGGSIVAF